MQSATTPTGFSHLWQIIYSRLADAFYTITVLQQSSTVELLQTFILSVFMNLSTLLSPSFIISLWSCMAAGKFITSNSPNWSWRGGRENEKKKKKMLVIH